MSQIEVMCPVNTTASMLMPQADDQWYFYYFVKLAVQILIASLISYSMQHSFLIPYHDWLNSEHSGIYAYVFLPIRTALLTND